VLSPEQIRESGAFTRTNKTANNTQDVFPQINKFAEIILKMPATNVSTQPSFSLLKRIKKASTPSVMNEGQPGHCRMYSKADIKEVRRNPQNTSYKFLDTAVIFSSQTN